MNIVIKTDNNMTQQMKLKYERPEIELAEALSESLMITASPGAGGEYDDDDPIDARENFEDDNWAKSRNLWEE